MTFHADGDSPTPPKRRGARADFRARVEARRADLEHQVQATRAQIDATNARIEARTGRNLVMAIVIGLGLGILMLFSLIVVKWLFMIFAGVLIAFTAFELASALARSGRRVPRIPIVIAVLGIVPAAYFLKAEGMWYAVLAGIALVSIWRLIELAVPGNRVPAGTVWRDIGAVFFIQIYVSFLASFSVLLVAQNNGGQWWTLAFLLIVVSIDTGAYATGLSFGKHPMAPTISPKKTWEGFAGAGCVAMIVGIALSIFMLGQPWWVGVVFGLTMLVTATVGDLAESLIKRDLGIKDMSSWLPGHGGFLDRLDSVLPSAAAAYALFLIFA